MADFSKAYALTMGHEGIYSNNPKDNGGETYKGIARKFHPTWAGWKIIDGQKSFSGFPGNLKSVAHVLEPLVQAFYKKEFWDVNRLDQVIHQAIANEMFDTAVNCGYVVAANFLQRSLNLLNRNGRNYPDLAVDGKIGPVTLGVLNRHPSPNNVLKCLNGFQFHWYVMITESNKTQEEFFNGWIERVSL